MPANAVGPELGCTAVKLRTARQRRHKLPDASTHAWDDAVELGSSIAVGISARGLTTQWS
jgi:hypothetical protein